MKSKLLNLVLRLSGLIVKSFAIIYLANLLESRVYEKYGLLFGAIPFVVIFLGFDIYTNYQRNPEYLTRKYTLPKEQFSIYFIFYSAIFCLILVHYLWSSNSFYFSLILVGIVEHFYQELFRFQNYIGNYIFASISQLLKSTVWVLVLVVTDNFFDYQISYLDIVAVYTVFSIIVIIIMLNRMPFRFSFVFPSLKTFGNILSKASLLFFNAVIWRFLLAGDRYLVANYFEDYSTKYIVSSQIALTLFLMYDAIFVSIEFPRLARNFGKEQYQNYFVTALSLLLLLCGVIISFFPVKNIADIKINYLDDFPLFRNVVVFYFFVAVNMLLDTAYILGKKEVYILALNFTCIAAIVSVSMFSHLPLNLLMLYSIYILLCCAILKSLGRQKIIFSHI